ncbi:hypothetical protein ABSL23_03375 [Halobacterium sp. NMX12-1]|uniref:DUF433 domain-containing protein n=1 Tax=Halobacterium sp. NMX12-1 TaxID=3166650 RepID=A0AAU8CD53_9EURY
MASTPETVASRLDLSLSEVYYALAYYHDHPDEMRAVEEERERVREMVVAFSNPILQYILCPNSTQGEYIYRHPTNTYA